MLCQHSCDDDATSQTAAAAQTAPDHHLDEWILELSDNNVTIWSRPVGNRTYREVKGDHTRKTITDSILSISQDSNTICSYKLNRRFSKALNMDILGVFASQFRYSITQDR